MEKYLYIQGFCEETHYACLQPVLYEEMQDGAYKKVRMACNGTCASCSRMDGCGHLAAAPDIIEPEKAWKLRDTLMMGTKDGR